jgi:hypothetical protein
MWLFEGISKHQQLKKKSSITLLNRVAAKRANSKPHEAARQQATAKTPAYEIPSVFAVLVFKL